MVTGYRESCKMGTQKDTEQRDRQGGGAEGKELLAGTS